MRESWENRFTHYAFLSRHDQEEERQMGLSLHLEVPDYDVLSSILLEGNKMWEKIKQMSRTVTILSLKCPLYFK